MFPRPGRTSSRNLAIPTAAPAKLSKIGIPRRTAGLRTPEGEELWGNFLAKLKSTAILHRIIRDQELPPAEVLCIWEIFHLVVESFAEPPATFSASLELIQRGNSLAPEATWAAVQRTETAISATPILLLPELMLSLPSLFLLNYERN